MEHTTTAWIAFNAFVLVLIALDLGVLHRERREIALREALLMTGGYIFLALAFNGWIYYTQGPKQGLDFLTSYLIEYALSMDNIMVFVVILAHFQVPPQYQMRVLVWGILGTLLLRGIFIFAGVALIERFEWLLIVLGIFLIYTGIRSLMATGEALDLDDNRVVRVARRVFSVTSTYSGERFFVRSETGKLWATPLFLVLVVLNITDIFFAIDSIPAVLAITRDPFIVYTSNVFAILGLRALYFALAGMLDRFRYLKIGLSGVLIFIGFKMVFNYPESLPDIPTKWALVVTALLIFGSIAASLLASRNDTRNGRPLA